MTSKTSTTLFTALTLCIASTATAAPLAPVQPRVAQTDDGDDSDTAKAKQHFYKGEKLFALGRFEAALEQYEAAFQTKPLPEFLFNIGQCHRNLGNFESAIFSFRKYLKLKPKAHNREAVKELIAELEVEIAAAKEAERKRREADLLRDEQERTPIGPIETPSSPLYKKWWFWAGVSVTAAAAGTATFLLINNSSGIPESDLGNLDFGK